MTLDCGSRPARRKTMRIAPRRCSTPSFAGIPSNERCAVLLSAVALLGIVLGLPGAAQAAPTVSSHTTVLVPTGGGLVNLIPSNPTPAFPGFPKPDPCVPSPCTDQRVMMAKFIVDETVNDLSFELRSNLSILKYSVTPFSTAVGVGNVSIVDNDKSEEAE